MSSVSVIIVSYHTGPALWLAFESVLAQPECAQLIVVNNGNVPGDETRLRALAAREKRMILIEGQGNVGFARGCNLGAKQATGDYILLLNPDSMLPEGGLARALAAMAGFPENTLGGSYLVNPDGSEQRGSRRALLTPRNAVVESLGLYRFFKSERINYHGTPMPESAHEVPVVSGAFMLLSRSFYARLGGMNEAYFLHMDDTDLCYRVHQAAGRVICMPEVKVVHFRSTSEVPGRFVEKQKAKSFIIYLNTYFSTTHSKLYLKLMAAGIWVRYGIKTVISSVDRAFVPPLAAKQEIARLVILNRLALFAPKDNSLAGKTILITGASGQVGLAAMGLALARGARVVAVYHRTRIAFAHPNLACLQCDLADKEALAGIKADVLVHTAALWMLPAVLPKLVDSGLKRVVAFSSTSVLGKADSTNKHEQEVVKKLEAAEEEINKLAALRQVNATIFRPTMIYGLGLDANITKIADVVRRFGFAPVYNPAGGFRHPVQALDLAAAALTILDNPATYAKTYSVGGPVTMTYRTMLESIFRYLGKPPKLVNMPYLPQILDALGAMYQMSNINGEMARRMNRDLVFDIQEAINDFGWAPHGFLEGEVTV